MRFKKILISLILLPEILLIGFFIYASVKSPSEAGRDRAEALGLPYPTIVAHRGLSHWAPEETRPAYELARDIGAHYLEVDVQRSKDGVLIALHDTKLSRTTNVAEVFPDRAKSPAGEFTWEELSKLDAGSWFINKHPKDKKRARASYKGLKILKLEELIDIAEAGENKPGLYIETKAPDLYPGIEKELVELLTRRGWIKVGEPVLKKQTMPRVIFQSFKPESLAKLKEFAPDVPRVLLMNSWTAAKTSVEDLRSKAKELGAIGIGPVGYLAYPWHTGPAHEEGFIVHPYTLNKPWQIWLVKRFGADGFFTDRADLALKYFDFQEKLDMEAILKKAGY